MKRNLLISLFALLLTAACGGGQSATTPPTPTQIPTYRYVTPTTMLLATEQATEVSVAAVTADTEAITQGEGRYVALKCGDCHGENGEGAGDKGPTLIGLTLSEVDFISFLRSGGKLGTAHQFASNRLSVKGAQNLYQYVMSLSS